VSPKKVGKMGHIVSRLTGRGQETGENESDVRLFHYQGSNSRRIQGIVAVKRAKKFRMKMEQISELIKYVNLRRLKCHMAATYE